MVLERRWIGALAVGGLAYAVMASFTRPFTWAANSVTAIPLVVAALITTWSNANADGVDSSRIEVGASPGHRPRRGRGWLVWMGPIVAVTGWELYCFFSLPRTVHPTLSSLLDVLDATRAGKTLAFAAWPALGWCLVAS